MARVAAHSKSGYSHDISGASSGAACNAGYKQVDEEGERPVACASNKGTSGKGHCIRLE